MEQFSTSKPLPSNENEGILEDQELWNALSAEIPLERIKTRLIDRVTFACDAGFYHLIPRAVVQPATESEIAGLFRLMRELEVPIVFRAAGTSLSGQSITDGILVDISRYWRQVKAVEQGERVCVQPGVIGSHVNRVLRPFGKKMGPDPASINAAMMGGILSNNSSGMCCGVKFNSYHTLAHLRFIMPDGKVYDTRVNGDKGRFMKEQSLVVRSLQEQRARILSQPELAQKIRAKYKMKNTVGYSLNALLDFEDDFDSFVHLLIGAEGTLAFIAEAELHTLPDLPSKSAALLFFKSIQEACEAIQPLADAGAVALELMDRAALRSVEKMNGIPDVVAKLPNGAAALLCEFQANDEQELKSILDDAHPVIQHLDLLDAPEFTHSEKQRLLYWKVRKGMFPSVGAVRKRGTTVILEDVAFPVPRLAEAVSDLQGLFRDFDYDNAIIFGHAKDGNLHFVITQTLDTKGEVDRYDHFLREVVTLVCEKYNGSLKGEHGTGRNMAPFVEAEWGGDAYEIMKALKEAVDPAGLLNPGVIINKDSEAHLHNLKEMPGVEEIVDKCIECGYCESHCPSRDLTMTPKRRIVLRRELARQQKAGNTRAVQELQRDYVYQGIETCAADGLCAVDCPVDINTGDLIKELRHKEHSTKAENRALKLSRSFGRAESLFRSVLQIAKTSEKLITPTGVSGISKGLKWLFPSMPEWMSEISAPPQYKGREDENPEVVYFSTCVSRMMAGSNAGEPCLQDIFLQLCDRARVSVRFPFELPGYCCGQVFSSKGYDQAARETEIKLVRAMWEWSEHGKIPIVSDFTSCTYTLIDHAHLLPKEEKYYCDNMRWIDSITFAKETLLPNLKILNPKASVALHPVCSAIKLGLQDQFKTIAEACAEDVFIPPHSGCCGMAGDRGLIYPELTESATSEEIEDLDGRNFDGYYASGKTCEIGLSHTSGKDYQHILYLIWEVSAVKN